MKTACVLAALVGSASAFVPAGKAATTSALQMSAIPEGYDDLVGIDVESGNKFFDPLNLAQWIPAKWARETELANGRSAMLATVGWFFPYVLGTFDSQDVTSSDPMAAILEASPQWWAQFIILCGTIEGFKYKKALEGKSFTGKGEPVVDYLKGYPTDEEGRRKMELKELKNGRLAMLGVASFLAAHYIPGSVPSLPADF